MRKTMTLATIAVFVGLTSPALAAEIKVKMLNRGTEGVMVFEPALVKIEPGDTVKFVATDKVTMRKQSRECFRPIPRRLLVSSARTSMSPLTSPGCTV